MGVVDREGCCEIESLDPILPELGERFRELKAYQLGVNR